VKNVLRYVDTLTRCVRAGHHTTEGEELFSAAEGIIREQKLSQWMRARL
jgi:hypothetical protein